MMYQGGDDTSHEQTVNHAERGEAMIAHACQRVDYSTLGAIKSLTKYGLMWFMTLLLFWLTATNLFAQSNWSSFRNSGSGLVTVDQVPLNWSPNRNVTWVADIPGYGQSAPVVWQGRVFVTSSNGPWQEQGYVHAFDLKSGRKIWTSQMAASTRVENYFRNSRAAPTCVVDTQIIVSLFPSGDVTALNHDGKIIWSKPVFTEVNVVHNDRGVASSLAQSREFIYMLVDHHGPSYLLALRKSDGSVAWKADRGIRTPSWSSPVVTMFKDREMILVSSSGTVQAYDAKTGESLWELTGLQGNHLASLSIVDDSIFVGAAPPMHGAFDTQKVASSNCRIRMTLHENRPYFTIAWKAERASADYATPLAFGGFVYYVNKTGILHCLDAETGREVFRNRLGESCWASPIGVTTRDGLSLVYFFLKNGETLILKPGKNFEVVARNQLWDEDSMTLAADSARLQREANRVPPGEAPVKEGPEKVFAGLPEKDLHKMFSYGDPVVYAAAMVEGRLLIRTGQHLFCIQTPGQVGKR